VIHKIRDIDRQRSTLTILVFLLDKKEIMSSKIRWKANVGGSSVIKAIDLLIKLDLVHDRVTRDPYYTRWISLTEKGRSVAMKLKEIDDLL